MVTFILNYHNTRILFPDNILSHCISSDNINLTLSALSAPVVMMIVTQIVYCMFSTHWPQAKLWVLQI